MNDNSQTSQPPDTKKSDEYISPFAEKLQKERLVPLFELIESEAKHHRAVNGYSSHNTEEYCFIELGDGYPEAIRKIANFTHKTAKQVLAEYMEQHVNSILDYARHIDDARSSYDNE